MIVIHLKIKFRAMGMTLYTLDREFKVGGGVYETVLFNERGVFLGFKRSQP